MFGNDHTDVLPLHHAPRVAVRRRVALIRLDLSYLLLILWELLIIPHSDGEDIWATLCFH